MGFLKNQIPILLNRFHCPQNKIRKVFTPTLSGTPIIKDCTPTTNGFPYWMLILHISNLYFTKQPWNPRIRFSLYTRQEWLAQVTQPSGAGIKAQACHCALVRNPIQWPHFSVWPLYCKVSSIVLAEIHDSLNLLEKFKWQHTHRLSTRSWWFQCLLELLQDLL